MLSSDHRGLRNRDLNLMGVVGVGWWWVVVVVGVQGKGRNSVSSVTIACCLLPTAELSACQ